jgi:hypothetical protein
MWLIPLAVFVLAFAKSFSMRESFNETVWFSVVYIGVLGVIYALDFTRYDYIKATITSPGGVIAMLAGFLAMWVRHKRWRKEEAEKKVARAAAAKAEAERRAAAGLPASNDGGVIAGAFRFAGSVQRSRKNAKSQSQTTR